MKAVKIDCQTYRIGAYIAFKLGTRRDSWEWKMGKPVIADDPISGGFIEGTVSFHATLKDCRQTVANRARMARFVAPCA